MSKKIQTQSEKFTEAARKLGCDESEERFDAALKTIAKQKPKEPPDGAAGRGSK